MPTTPRRYPTLRSVRTILSSSITDGVVLTGAALSLIVIAGCSSEPIVAPASRLAPAAHSASDMSGALPDYLHPNSEKYADNGAHPSTGRSGSASIMSRALLGKDGSTQVEATTGTLDAGTPPGTITKVQAKLTHAGQSTTNNYNGLDAGGYWTTSYTTLRRSDQVQVQANVGGIDGNRNDVVTVVDVVKLRPDLLATELQVPASAHVNTVVEISATVKEINRDVGARANCVLSVDGQAVGQARGIWVDAGDAVSCAFANSFSQVGQHTITVSADNVVPADWDTANNAVSGTITIVSPEIDVGVYNWGLRAESGTFTYRIDEWDDHFMDSGSEDLRSAWIYGTAYDPTPIVMGPATITLAIIMDGQTVQTSTSLTRAFSSYGPSVCFAGFDRPANVRTRICQYLYAGQAPRTYTSATLGSRRVTYYEEEWWGDDQPY